MLTLRNVLNDTLKTTNKANARNIVAKCTCCLNVYVLTAEEYALRETGWFTTHPTSHDEWVCNDCIKEINEITQLMKDMI